MSHPLTTLWRFSRPHTIIGSLCSITTLYLLALEGQSPAAHPALYGWTLLAALSCNVFIVGLNQVVDVALDKINKPWLPLASGELAMPVAKRIIYTSLAVSLIAAAFASWLLLAIIMVITLIGVAYSVPPVQLKKHHLPAALCITLVRGLIVNIGILLHFIYAIHHQYRLPAIAWPLTLFIIAFSIAIAWFKDLPDTEGDAIFKFRTFPLLYSKAFALRLGALGVSAAYGYALYWAFRRQSALLGYGHLVLLVLFGINCAVVRLAVPASVKGFYLRFWFFFFAEYILFAVWAVVYGGVG